MDDENKNIEDGSKGDEVKEGEPKEDEKLDEEEAAE